MQLLLQEEGKARLPRGWRTPTRRPSCSSSSSSYSSLQSSLRFSISYDAKFFKWNVVFWICQAPLLFFPNLTFCKHKLSPTNLNLSCTLLHKLCAKKNCLEKKSFNLPYHGKLHQPNSPNWSCRNETATNDSEITLFPNDTMFAIFLLEMSAHLHIPYFCSIRHRVEPDQHKVMQRSSAAASWARALWAKRGLCPHDVHKILLAELLKL